jgi:Spy/CpxP family protein refolding chaperone
MMKRTLSQTNRKESMWLATGLGALLLLGAPSLVFAQGKGGPGAGGDGSGCPNGGPGLGRGQGSGMGRGMGRGEGRGWHGGGKGMGMGRGMRHGRHGGWGRGGGMGGGRFAPDPAVLKQRLGLSDAQVKQMETLRTQHQAGLEPLRLEKRRLHAQLRVVWLEQQPDFAKVKALTDKLAAVQQKLAQKRVDHRIAVAKVLTPAQRLKFLAGGFGQGRGRGPGF